MTLSVRQLRTVTDQAISGTARLAGAELITFPNTEASFPEVKDRIAKTIDFVKTFKPMQIDGTEDKEIVVKFSSGERKFKGQAFLLNFCLPNFYSDNAMLAMLQKNEMEMYLGGNVFGPLVPTTEMGEATSWQHQIPRT